MRVHIIETGKFKLDGGAMFGVVPKKLWQKINPPDEENMCTWAMRCLLVETGDQKILIDTGMGDKQGEKFRSHFHPHGEDTLTNSLRQRGFAPEDITDVFLTHLHFDHVGGAV
jgi:glyoxylase-like metal-dependent hydrolase (beta-lactamase superfamily II)